jgi:3-phenylpropionate/trans-cinnamate dioxygenase ferredoxin subunit
MLIKIAKKIDIPKQGIKVFNVKGKRIGIVNIKEEFFAIDGICTHDECSLAEGEMEDQEIICPCHGARFNAKTGQVLTLPAIKSLKAYSVKIKGSDIFVDIEK